MTARFSFDFGPHADAGTAVFGDAESALTFAGGESFALAWDEPVSVRLCLQWQTMPEDVSVLQYDADGTLLATETLQPVPETVTPLLENARRAVVQAGDAGMELLLCAVYGPGELPDPFHEWKETPTRLDYLLIATHPDDDVLFLGSTVPILGAERGFTGTIAYVTCTNRVRMSEAENGAWAMGLRYRPVFLGMKDVRQGASEQKKAAFQYDDLLVNVVRTYRRLRPLVVFAQDENGEYGHWQHVLTSKAAREAFALAADPSFDPESVERYGAWQVQKLFLHLYGENPLVLDAHAPLSFFGGRNAYEVACEAFLKHASQQKGRYAVGDDGEPYAFNRFGMAEGVVPVGKDAFDNIDERLLSNFVEPTPEPTPEPSPSLLPTLAPTAELVAEPTPALTALAEPTPESHDHTLPIVLAGGFAALAALSAICLARKRNGKKE